MCIGVYALYCCPWVPIHDKVGRTLDGRTCKGISMEEEAHGKTVHACCPHDGANLSVGGVFQFVNPVACLDCDCKYSSQPELNKRCTCAPCEGFPRTCTIYGGAGALEMHADANAADYRQT